MLMLLLPVQTVLSSCSDGIPAGESSDSKSDANSSEDAVSVSRPDDSAVDEDVSSKAEESADPSTDESGNDPADDESSVPNEAGEISETPAPDETSGTESGVKDYPVLNGSFMQPSYFAGYSEERLVKHLEYMREVGIDKLILQWSFTTENGKVQTAYFNSSFAQNDRAAVLSVSDSQFLDKLLSAAEKTGFKVFVGLNDNAEWWQKGVNDISWIKRQAELGIEGAKQIYAEYKPKYKNALYGWYFVFEFYNMYATSSQIENAAELLNLYRNGLYSISPEMPMMLSPFLSSAGANAALTQQLWTEVFNLADFKEGDIFCCQDSVGAGHITIDKLDGYFKAIKAAVDTEKGLKFWANNEDFTQSDWSTAPLTRFVEQMNISDKYVEEHITFAYCHYQNPDTGKTGYHNAYKSYYENGVIAESQLVTPSVEYTASDDGNTVKIKCTANDKSHTLCGISVTRNGEVIKYYDYSLDYGKEDYSFDFTDYNSSDSNEAKYSVFAMDYSGNEGPAFSFTIKREGHSGRNAAAGKSYTLTTAPEQSYPDENNKSLTDGKIGQAAYYDSAWVGFLGRPEMVFDLGTVERAIYALEIGTLGGGSAGVYCPSEFTVEVSTDGKNYRRITVFKPDHDQGVDQAYRVSHSIPLTRNVTARYVKITVATDQSWIFIDEVKIFAD